MKATIERTEQVLDFRTVESLRDFGAFAEIVGEFVGEAPMHIEVMERAADDKDFDTLQREAHTLKGASGVVGAVLMAMTAERIEQLARTKTMDGVSELLDRLDADFEKTRVALESALTGTRMQTIRE